MSNVEDIVVQMSDLYRQAAGSLDKGVVIFGAGPYGRVAARQLRQMGARVGAFVDNDPAKQNTVIDGLPVASPAALGDMAPAMVFIAARHAVDAVSRQLREANIPNISFDAFFVIHHYDRIRAMRDDYLSDLKSRTTCDALLKTLLTGRKSFCAEASERDHYFCLPRFSAASDEHFIDAGAYVGDTVEKFIWANNGAFNRVYAFEPGREQFQALTRRVTRLASEWALQEGRIVCVPAGLGADGGTMSFVGEPGMLQSATLSTDVTAGEAVSVYRLDDYLAGRPATYLKADIEGMEMAMLQGAVATIKRYRPKLAISIYHEPDHFFTIPEYVRSLVPEYKMALRQHSPVLVETVLYCWVED